MIGSHKCGGRFFFFVSCFFFYELSYWSWIMLLELWAATLRALMGLNDPDQHHLPLATHWAWSHSLGCVGVPVRSPALGGGTPPAAPLQPPSLLLLTAQGPGSHLLWGCQWSLWGSQLCLPWATACWGGMAVAGVTLCSQLPDTRSACWSLLRETSSKWASAERWSLLASANSCMNEWRQGMT